MELVGIIALVLVLVAGVVLLWRSTPPKSERPKPSDDDRAKDAIVDVTPSGLGGGGGGN